MTTDNINNLKLDVELLKKDIEQFDDLSGRITLSIEKLQDVNQNLIKMISLHEQRHDQHISVQKDLDVDIKDLHSRITTINREIHDRIDQVDYHTTGRMDSLKTDLIKHKKEDRMPFVKWDDIDKLKWFFMGVLITIGFALGKLDIFSLI